MIRRPSDLYPADTKKVLLPEVRRLAKLPEPWADVIPVGPGSPDYAVKVKYNTIFEKFARNLNDGNVSRAADLLSFLSTTEWVRQGPKIVNVSEEAYQALSRVDVNMQLNDVTQPFPCVMVNMPPGKKFRCVLVYRMRVDFMILSSWSYDNADDITTCIYGGEDKLVEESLNKYYDIEVEQLREDMHAAQRVAVNMMLVLSNFGHHSEYVFPKEVADDESLCKKKAGTEAAERAKDRLREAPTLLTLDRTIRLMGPTQGSNEPGEPTGRKRGFGWVRGHWKMQAHGVGRVERKRLYIAPYMVHKELIGTVPVDETTVTYE